MIPVENIRRVSRIKMKSSIINYKILNKEIQLVAFSLIWTAKIYLISFVKIFEKPIFPLNEEPENYKLAIQFWIKLN